jgi:hypothetical protein
MLFRIFTCPRLSKRYALPALALVVSLAHTTIATAQGKAEPFPSACGTMEIRVLTVIEEHGAAGDVSSDRLSAAAMTMLLARSTCYAGRVGEALALYEGALALGRVASLSEKRS